MGRPGQLRAVKASPWRDRDADLATRFQDQVKLGMVNVSFVIAEPPDSFGSFENFSAVLRRIKELGYEGVEFNLTQPAGFELNDLTRFAESIRLQVVSFLTGANYFRQGLCLSSPRIEVREQAVEQLRKYAQIAAQFGAVLVIGQMQGFLSDEPDRAVGEARIEESLKQVVAEAERHGATIAFEPVNHLQVGFNNSLMDVMGLMARIGSSHFKPMLDTFHMNIEERSVTEPIHRAGPNIAHFHLCESNGGLLGSGHLDFKAIFGAIKAIGYPGWVSVKTYRQPWAVGAEASMRFLTELGVIA
jgi:sugar phosphate isomerase/epimerase